MAYKVLYRKYRPDCFEKVVGQNTTINTLKNSIINNNFSHAYMFTGPRGTGKTSTAKILARAINCENPINGEPCGKCSSCVNFTTSPDIIEIDAASNNGVDEIRELRNNVTLAPSASKYKIYIIDEVHMLSAGAFNALLKTIEEPPSHAIFILATTEIYKVPITILSRCQRFDFKKINRDDMIKFLADICTKEELNYDSEALEEIYLLSEGCLRDALSILDQMSKTTKELKLDNILESYNLISNKNIDELLAMTNNNDVEGILRIINKFENSGMNPQKIIKKTINYLENIAVNVKLNKEKRYDYDKISKLIKSLNECYIDARINENTYAIIKLSFLDLIEKPPEKAVENKSKTNNEEERKIFNIKNLIEIRINNCFVDANRNSLAKLQKIWNDMDKSRVESIDLSIYTPTAASENYAIFKVEDSSLADLFNIKAETIEKQLIKNNITIKVVALSEKDWQKEKEQYKEKLQKNIKYRYIEEPFENEYSKIGDINNLFADSPIEIN